MRDRSAYEAVVKDFEKEPTFTPMGRLADRGRRPPGYQTGVIVRVPMKFQKNCSRSGRSPLPPPTPPRPQTPPPYITGGYYTGEHTDSDTDSNTDSDISNISNSKPWVDNYTESDVDSIVNGCLNCSLELVDDMFSPEINAHFDAMKEETDSPDDLNVSREVRPGTPGWGKFVWLAR